MVFVLIPLTKLVMNVILSDSYKVASIYIGFLYLGTVFQGFSSFSSIGYLQGKQTGGAAKTSIYGAVVNLGIDLICIKFIGLFAAALSTFLGFFVMWITRMRDIKHVFPIKIDVKIFGTYLIAAIAMAIGVIWTNNIADLLLAAVAGLFFLFDNRNSLKQVLQMAKHKRKDYSNFPYQ